MTTPTVEEILYHYDSVREVILKTAKEHRLDFLKTTLDNFKIGLMESGLVKTAVFQEGFRMFLNDLPPDLRA